MLIFPHAVSELLHAGEQRLAPAGAPGPSTSPIGRGQDRGQREIWCGILMLPALCLHDKIPHQFSPNHWYLPLSVHLYLTVQVHRTRTLLPRLLTCAPSGLQPPTSSPLAWTCETLSCHRRNDFNVHVRVGSLSIHFNHCTSST